MDNDILAALTWDGEAGALAYQGVRYLLIRPETVMQVQRALEAEIGPERAGELVYAGGFTGGRLSGLRYKQTFGLSAQEAVEFMCRMGGQLGWGAFNLHSLDLAAGRLEVVVRNSVFATGYAQLAAATRPQHPTCHLIRGVLGGLLSGLLDAPVHAHEAACLALGDPACHFIVEAHA